MANDVILLTLLEIVLNGLVVMMMAFAFDILIISVFISDTGSDSFNAEINFGEDSRVIQTLIS